jgi:hypothetical protein
MNLLCKLAMLVLLASASSGAARAAEKTEATPGALDRAGGMKQHEKEIRKIRNATPGRGQEMRRQGHDEKAPQ